MVEERKEKDGRKGEGRERRKYRRDGRREEITKNYYTAINKESGDYCSRVQPIRISVTVM